MSAAGIWGAPVQLSVTLCAQGVAAAALSDGTAAAAFGTKSAKGCELTVSLRAVGGGFAAPVAWTAGAHASVPAAVGTAGGNFAFAYDDATKAGVYAITGNTKANGTPVQLGKAGTPSIAAGGGHVSAVWCNTLCYGSVLVLP